jgi:7-carboxy-7-deazaguanine synthase
MVINEIFYSLQGEGFLAGAPSVFVRLSGCPLRCRWCDTKYAWDESAGTEYGIIDVVQIIKQRPCRHIVITGGEPMVSSELPELVKQVKALDKHITVETAGIVFVPNLTCDLMSISPKLGNSEPRNPGAAALHQKSRLEVSVLRRLVDAYKYQLKFVVECENDLSEIHELLAKIGPVDMQKVMLMPLAATRDELLARSPMVADLCKRTGFTFSPRLQVLLWNGERGK